jgi:hypothetical protein
MFSCSFACSDAFLVRISALIFKFSNLLLHVSNAILCEEDLFAHDVDFHLEHIVVANCVIQENLLVLYVMVE